MRHAFTVGAVVLAMLVSGAAALPTRVAVIIPTQPTVGPLPPGHETSAAYKLGWGQPNRIEDFDEYPTDGWGIYDGPGHGGNGLRTPLAVDAEDGVMTIEGDSDGDTAGMAWVPGQMYGRWEGRVQVPVGDDSYHALLLLWPDAEDWPVGGEVDFMEIMEGSRSGAEMFLHYGADNSQVSGRVQTDATQWHNWAVEWTPDHIVAFLDGKEWFRSDDKKTLPPGPMHLCIQLDWFPDDADGDVQESEMRVDWVRQYPLRENVPPTQPPPTTAPPTTTPPTTTPPTTPPTTTPPTTTPQTTTPTTPPATTPPTTPPAAAKPPTTPPTTTAPTTTAPPTTTPAPGSSPGVGAPAEEQPGVAPATTPPTTTPSTTTPTTTTPSPTTTPPATTTPPTAEPETGPPTADAPGRPPLPAPPVVTLPAVPDDLWSADELRELIRSRLQQVMDEFRTLLLAYLLAGGMDG